MQLPQLTLDQIQQRCTEQSFTRGLDYFHAGAIDNPVPPRLHSVSNMQGYGYRSVSCHCRIDAGRDRHHLLFVSVRLGRRL